MRERPPDLQKSMSLLLAKKENWEKVSPLGDKYYRKGYPHLWKGGNTLFDKNRLAAERQEQ
jgi:hypothetical protein